MSANPMLLGVETAAQHLAEEMTRALPVTLASVALWDQPSFALTVKAVNSHRPLEPQPVIGARVPLSTASWHRAVFERREPVLLDQGSPDRVMSLEEARLSLMPDLRSIYLMPILIGDEMIGVLALGEMRSRDREPFTEEKRRRCVEILEEVLAASAYAWEAGRLRRQVRAMSSIVQIVKQMLAVQTYQDLLGCLASKVADWLGAPVRGILLQALPGNGMEVVARWQFPETATEGYAGQLLLAMARAEGRRQGPISVVKVSEDPLDPLSIAATDGETWTRVSLPLLRGDRLVGVVCLYAQEDLYPTNWELEVFRWLAEIASGWMGIVGTLREQRSEQEWLRAAAWELVTTHQRTVLREALAGVEQLLAALLPVRLERVALDLGGFRSDGEAAARRFAEAATDEITAVFRDLQGVHGAGLAATSLTPIEVNELVRRTVDIVRLRREGPERPGGGPIELAFEPAAEPIVVETSVALVGALAHAIESAAQAMPEGGQIRVRTHRDDGHVLISVTDDAPAIVEEPPRGGSPSPFSLGGRPHGGLALSVIRAWAARHGGEVQLLPGEVRGTTLILRLPAVPGLG